MGRHETSSGNKQAEQPSVHKVVLSIKSQDGEPTYFRFVRDKKIQYLFSTYCKEKNLDYSVVSFVYNGQRIKATKTPNELGLEDGDEIDAMVHQNGGGYAGNDLNPKCF